MAYQGIPRGSTTYSAFHLLRGREMVLPTSQDLRAKLTPDFREAEYTPSLENLKSVLNSTYRLVRDNNRKSQKTNKSYFDHKAKEMSFASDDIMYLLSPAKKRGQCSKFWTRWAGSFKVVARLSKLNYRIMNQQGIVGSARKQAKTGLQARNLEG